MERYTDQEIEDAKAILRRWYECDRLGLNVRLTAEAMDLPRHEVRAIVSAAAEIVGVDPPAWHNAFRNSPNRAKVVHTMGQAICLKITGGHLKRMGLEYGDECQIVYHPDSNTTEIIPEKNLTKRYDDPFELENQFSD